MKSVAEGFIYLHLSDRGVILEVEESKTINMLIVIISSLVID